MKYFIAKILISIFFTAIFIGNTWWCMFVSDKDGVKLFAWWFIIMTICIVGLTSLLFLISDKETDDKWRKI